MKLACCLALAIAGCTPSPQQAGWDRWIREHGHPIRSLDADADPADFAFLEPLLRGRRIVQLGENGHGVAEFSRVKVRLIRHLHEQLGFDVIAFESGFLRCHRANAPDQAMTAYRLMRMCVPGVWHTEDVLALFAYVLETRRTERPLLLAGFDVENAPSDTGRTAMFRTLLTPLDAAYARRVGTLDSTLQKRMMADDREYVVAHVKELGSAYDSLATVLSRRRDDVVAASRTTGLQVEVAAQVARSVAAFVRSGAADTRDHSSGEANAVRDRAMADNLNFLADRLYAGRKLITWSHNRHVRNRGAATEPWPGVTTGQWIAERRRGELYTIGLYMQRGQVARNDRKTYSVDRIRPGSLEAILSRAGTPWLFVDMLGQQLEPGNSWMFTSRAALLNGNMKESFIPRDQYDGILFVDSVSPPRYR